MLRNKMARICLVVVFTAGFAGLASAQSGGGGGGGSSSIGNVNDINGGSGFTRHSGYAWVSGPMLTQNFQAQTWSYPNPNPRPGNIGTWGASIWFGGNFLDNPTITADDIQFALDNTLSNSGGRNINVLSFGPETITFDQTFSLSWQINSQLYNQSLGGAVANLWDSNSLNLDVSGGSITHSDFYIATTTTLVNGSPFPLGYDWQATAQFSGIIQAPNFSVSFVPEPGSLVMIGIGGIATMYRRQRSRMS